MKIKQDVLIFFTVMVFYSCSSPSVNGVSAKAEDTLSSEIPYDTSSTVSSNVVEKMPEVDTITTVKFREVVVSINRLVIYDEENKINQIQKDTAKLYAELGETIEGQYISVLSEQLMNIIVEQRYETSVTIMNEGPHCDLIDWKHYYSDWQRLSPNQEGKFMCKSYTEEEGEKFPAISIKELRQQARKECGENWFEQIKQIKSPTDYPSRVGISRYYLRIVGEYKSTGRTESKLIIIENPMGC